jgi:hypothetical protein
VRVLSRVFRGKYLALLREAVELGLWCSAATDQATAEPARPKELVCEECGEILVRVGVVDPQGELFWLESAWQADSS